MPYIKNAILRYRIIDRCLRNEFKPYPTKQDLREACEEALYGTNDGVNICDSTIEKDIFNMRMDHDAPIKYSKRHIGYYYEDQSFSINDIPLTEEDLSSIRFALNTLTQFKETAMFQQFGSAIDKIVDRVSIAGNPQDAMVNNFVQFEQSISSGGSEYLPELLRAIQNSLMVTLEYSSFVSPKPKKRKLAPLLLKEFRNRWYLIAQDLQKDKILTFGLDRMSKVNIVEDEYVNKPQDFDPEAFFKYATGISVFDGEPETVLLKTSNVAARYIESQPFHESQKVTKRGKNKTNFKLKVWVSEEFIRALLSYGSELEVVEPKSLRDAISARVQAMTELYK